MIIKELSKPGSYHLKRNMINQDFICSERNRNIGVISVADGVSTCSEAKSGAEIAGRSITDLLYRKHDYFMEFDKEQVARLTLEHILFELVSTARTESKDLSEYSSTVASVVINKKRKRLLSFNLGDGMIMATGHGCCKVLSAPQDSSKGCCVTTTRGAESEVSVDRFSTDGMDSVILCSDGAWRQMFCKNRLKDETARMLINHEYDKLGDFLMRQDSFDDYSFVALVM